MSWNRRTFLGSSAGSVAALTLGVRVFGADGEPAAPVWGPPQAPHSSLFLTWQRDPTTTMTVQWIGPLASDEDSTISYAPLAEQAWRVARTLVKPFPHTDLRVFRCELTGLEPGGEYKFSVGGEKAAYRFRTMPAKTTNEICFVSGGDAGISDHAQASNVVAAKQDPQFVLLAGDVAYDNNVAPDTVVKFFENYARALVDSSGRLIPLVTCLGNHEVKGQYGGTREDAASYLSLFDGFYSDLTYGALDIGDYLSLVLLDTGHIAKVAGEQTSWLEKTLAERQDRQHLIAVNHVPAYPSYHNFDGKDDKNATPADQRAYWCPLFDKYRVDVVLEHHDHTFKRTHPLVDGRVDKNGVVYLGDGSWGKIRAPKEPDNRPYLAKTSEVYHVSVHYLQGDRRFHVALQDTGKVADVSMTESKRASRRG
jgi:hypothetical protein